MWSTGLTVRCTLALTRFIAAVFASPWVVLIVMGLLALRWRAWEVLVIGLWMDFLWLPGAFFSSLPLFTFAAIALVWGFEPLRREFLTP